MIERFVEFLTGGRYDPERPRNYWAKRIAILSEDETAYGGPLFDRGSQDSTCYGERDRTDAVADDVVIYDPRDKRRSPLRGGVSMSTVTNH